MARVAGETELFRRVRVYLLLLLATAILLGGVVGARYYLSLPDLGFSFGRGDVVGSVEPGGPAELAGLRVADRILAISGASPLAGEAYVRPGQKIVPLTIQRHDQTLDLEIVPSSPPMGDIWNRLAYLVTALAFWIMAVVVLVFKPHDTQAQTLALGLLLAALGIVVVLLADVGLAWASLLMDAIVLALGPIYVYYHTIFPERTEFRGRKAMLLALFGLSTLLLLASIWVRAHHREQWSTLAISTTKAYFALCLCLGFALLVWTSRRTTSEARKRQVWIVVLGIALAVLPLVIFILLPQIVPNLPYVTIGPAFLALAFIPASYLYAIFWHNLMRMDWVVSQSAAHFFLFLTLFVLYLAVSWLVRWLASLTPAGLLKPTAVTALEYLVLIVVLMASLQPLRVRIEKLVHRLFYRGWYDYKSFISHMTEKLGDALDVQDVVDLLVEDVAGTMRLKAIALLLPDRQGTAAFGLHASQGFDLPASLCLEKDLVALLKNMEGPVEHQALQAHAGPELSVQGELAVWSDAGAQMWVPLVQQEELEGILVLGAKQADEFLTENDQDILHTLGRHTASAIARAHLVEQLHGRLREIQALSRKLLTIQEEQRRRIAADIHDHAIQDLIGARMKLGAAMKAPDWGEVGAVYEELRDIVSNLRSVNSDLRPSATNFSDLAQMLKEHAITFQRKRGLPVLLRASGDGNQVPEKVRQAVFYVFRESLNNAWKHAQAEQAVAILEIQPGRVHLEVIDDGVGFDMPPFFDELIIDGHLGLTQMREWVADVGGTFEMVSQSGEGTMVLVDVPLVAREEERAG